MTLSPDLSLCGRQKVGLASRSLEREGSALEGADVDVGAMVAVDEGERVVEVLGRRHEVGVLPHGIAAGDAAPLLEQRPQRGRVTQASWSQLESRKRGEGLLGRAAGRPATAHRLAERRDRRQRRRRRGERHRVDPTLHEREQRLEPGQRRLLLRRRRGLEQALGQRLLQRRRIARVDVPRHLLQLRGVDGDALRVAADQLDQPRCEPRHVPEQPVVRGFPKGEEQPYVVRRHLESVAERRHSFRKQRGDAGRAERQADVGRAHDFFGEAAQRLAELAAEHQPADLLHDAHQRAGHRPHLLGDRLAHGSCDAGGDRLDELAPLRLGRLEPAPTAPRLTAAYAGAHRGHRVEPQVGEADRLGDGCSVGGRRTRVRPDHGQRRLLGEVPVDRAVLAGHEVAELAQHGAEVGDVATFATAAGAGAGESEGELAHPATVDREDEVMAGPAKPVRRGRSAGSAIAVTGGCGELGALLLDRLAGRADAPKLIGIDTARGTTPDVTWRIADVRDPTLSNRLKGVGTLVHLATDRQGDVAAEQRRAVNVRGTEVVLAAAHAAGVERVVLVTSAMVYGAVAGSPVPLPEDAPVRAEADAGLVGDWVEVERLAAGLAGRDGAPAITVIRPAPVVGPVADGLLPRLFEAPRLLALRDGQPHWQFCHVDDLVTALEWAALGRVSGVVTVGGEGWLSQREVEQVSGLRSVVLPAALAFATAERLQRVGVLPAPASELHYLAHPWVVGSQQLRAAGWVPAWDNAGALRAHLDALGDGAGRGALARLQRNDAPRAAAGGGATVAVVGALAIARARARRRRG